MSETYYKPVPKGDGTFDIVDPDDKLVATVPNIQRLLLVMKGLEVAYHMKSIKELGY